MVLMKTPTNASATITSTTTSSSVPLLMSPTTLRSWGDIGTSPRTLSKTILGAYSGSRPMTVATVRVSSVMMTRLR